MHNIAAICCGYRGRNLVRNCYGLKTLRIIDVADEMKPKEMKSLYPQINIANKLNEIFQDESIRGIAVATCAESHYEVTKEALPAGCLSRKVPFLESKGGQGVDSPLEEEKGILMVDQLIG